MGDILILLVDDEVIHLKIANKILTDEGYETVVFTSAEEALSFLSGNRKPDLILLDIEMPETSGLKAISTIKEIEGCDNIPVIFLTSDSSTQSELKGLELGAVDYIKKPYKKSIILARIKAHLNTYNIIREKETGKNDPLAIFDQSILEKTRSILSPTEYEVACLIALGYSNKDAANQLSYSYGYVKQLTHDIYKKLNLTKRSELRLYFNNEL